MPKKPAFEWTALTGSEKQAAFVACDIRPLRKAQLRAMLEWNDPNGDYEQLSRADLITCLESHRVNADDVDPTRDLQSDLDMDELLCVLLQKYCAAAELPYMDAESLINSDRLTAAQRSWLGSFVDMWDATIELIEARDAKVQS